MASESVIILYDLASNNDDLPTWNPFVIKTRYALELKNLPYKRVLLEYPDIKPTFEKLGALPGGKMPNGNTFYSVPVIADHINRTSAGEPTIVSDSWDIAVYLDFAYPDRPLLFPSGTKALQQYFHDQFWNEIFPIFGLILLSPAHDFLNEKSQGYFRMTREGFVNMKLEDLCPKGTEKCEELWSGVQKVLTGLARNGESSFIMGNQPSYADVTILSILECNAILMPEDWKERTMKWDNGRWEKLKREWDAYCTK